MNPTLSEFTGIRQFVVMLSTFVLVACGEAPQQEVKEIVRPVKLMTLGAGGASTTLGYPGEVSAARSVELGFEVPGKIVELPISDGLAVKKAALLGRLDDADYAAARDAAEANRKAAESAYERAKRIFDQGAGSQADVDSTLRGIDVAKQDLKKAQKALEDTNERVLGMGGIPWKAEAPAQKQIIRRMDPNTFALMNRIRSVLDPKGIMNPGNWEMD